MVEGGVVPAGWEEYCVSKGHNLVIPEKGCKSGRVGQRGMNIHRAEVHGPQGGRVGQRGVILHRAEVHDHREGG